MTTTTDNATDEDIERYTEAIAALRQERDTLQGVQQIAVDNYNAIWLMVRGNKVGEWDYPAQVTRYVGHMCDDLAAAQKRLTECEAALDGARQTFVTIQAYPDIENEMNDGMLIQGMIQQAVFGAEQAYKALPTAADTRSADGG